MRTTAQFTEHAFTVETRDGTQSELRGAYILSDCGYQKWRMFQMPIARPLTDDEFVYSKRLESARKDVERTFGRMKVRTFYARCRGRSASVSTQARFRILKLPLQFKHQVMAARWAHCMLFHVSTHMLRTCMHTHATSFAQDTIDSVFIACAMLHNMILRHNGMHMDWREQRNWEQFGMHEDLERLRQALNLPMLGAASDFSGIGAPPRVHHGDDLEPGEDESHFGLRRHIIEHVYTLHTQGRLLWQTNQFV